MDAGLAHGLWTALLLVTFAAIVGWAWSGRRKRDFDEAARLPLEDDPPAAGDEVGSQGMSGTRIRAGAGVSQAEAGAGAGAGEARHG